MTAFDGLITVMSEARELLATPDNDFTWSAWADQEAALTEMDRLIGELRHGSMPDLSPLFASTGPIQEVSVSSGWGERFLALARRLDEELARLARAGT